VILLGDPSKEQSQEILNILKKGGYLIFIPIEELGFHSVVKLEDIGFEVRDSVFVADGKTDFHYFAKPSRSEREAGLKGFNKKTSVELTGRKEGSAGLVYPRENGKPNANPYAGTHGLQPKANIHPTVKPIKVMEWCARDLELGSKVVDPFLGSGTTGIACTKLKHDFVGVELNKEYASIATKRIEYWSSIGTEIKSEAEIKEDKKGMVSLF
jgi:DNA modification methylase